MEAGKVRNTHALRGEVKFECWLDGEKPLSGIAHLYLNKTAENPQNERLEEEFGDLLFSMINLSRFLGLNAENSLTNATNKFINRCVGIERFALKRGEKLNQMSAEDIDILWQSMKQQKSAE